MSINIDPSGFQQNRPLENAAPKVYSATDIEAIKKGKTDVVISGDVFTYGGVSFKSMSDDELLSEKIDKSSLHLTQISRSDKKADNRVIIAFRDPVDPEKVIAYKLDKEVVDELKNSFSKKDFFQRDDGILRLNGNAEEYIAGWVLDIRDNRGYENADADHNGIISEEEQKELNVGFEQTTKYDYLGRKIATAYSYIGGETYQKLSDIEEKEKKEDHSSIIDAQSLKFENSIEKELSHTIKLDKDKDGTITLQEGLKDFADSDKSTEETLVNHIKIAHNAWIEREHIQLNEYKVLTNRLTPLTKKEVEEAWEMSLNKYNELMEDPKNRENFENFKKAQLNRYETQLLQNSEEEGFTTVT